MGDRSAIGVGYTWERAEVAHKTVLRLVAWNTVAFGPGIDADVLVNNAQYISTGTNRYVALTRDMLEIEDLASDADALDLTYNNRQKVSNLLYRVKEGETVSAVSVSASELQALTLGDLEIGIYANTATGVDFTKPLSDDTVLAAGNYVWRIAVKADHDFYEGYVDIAVTVEPKKLTVTITNTYNEEGNEEVTEEVTLQEHNDESGKWWSYTYNRANEQRVGLVLGVAIDKPPTSVSLLYYQGTAVDEDQIYTSDPTERVGTYTVRVVCGSNNYRADINGMGVDTFRLFVVEEN